MSVFSKIERLLFVLEYKIEGKSKNVIVERKRLDKLLDSHRYYKKQYNLLYNELIKAKMKINNLDNENFDLKCKVTGLELKNENLRHELKESKRQYRVLVPVKEDTEDKYIKQTNRRGDDIYYRIDAETGKKNRISKSQAMIHGVV